MKNIGFTILALLLGPMQLSIAQTWMEADKIVATNRHANAFFGIENTVSLFGDYAIVGARFENHAGLTRSGAAYIYKRDNVGCNWVLEQKILPDTPTAHDWFGISVAINDSYAVVGSWDGLDENNLNPLYRSGSVYIFEKDAAGIWQQSQKIVASDRHAQAGFANDVDISRNQIVVGCVSDDIGLNGPSIQYPNAGSAYVFEFNGVNWIESQKLVASDRFTNDQFGVSVAISNNYVVVGAHGDDEDANGLTTIDYSGSAYIFEKNGTWSQIQKITSSDRGQHEFFGRSVDIDGNFIIAGVEGDDEDEQGGSPQNYAGSAFIFERDISSGFWSINDKIDASDRSVFDLFGHSVAISDKGKALVGAYFEDDNALGNSPISAAGSAYLYEYDGVDWVETQKIVPNDRDEYDRFGTAVSLFENRVIIGASHENEDDSPIPTNTFNDAGSAYIFELNDLADQPILATSTLTFCPGSTVTLTIDSGNLNGASNWQWYSGSCNGTLVGTGASITVTPVGTTTYYVNGVGGCVSAGPCSSVTVNQASGLSWHQTTLNTLGGEDITNDVISDSDGNVYVTGTFKTQTTLGGGNNSNSLMTTNAGALYASYVAKYTPCGDLLWQAHSTGSRDNKSYSITLDETNHKVYIAGVFYSNLRFVPSGLCPVAPPPIYTNGPRKGYVAAFNMNSGCVLSVDPVIQNTYTVAKAITIDESSGNVFVGGYATPNPNGTSYTSYMHKYQPVLSGIGAIISNISSVNGGTIGNMVNDLDFDENMDRLWVIGNFDDYVTFFPGTGQLAVSSPTTIQQDAYLLAYTDNGNNFIPVLNRKGNSTLSMSGEGVSVNPSTGNPYFTGTYKGGVTNPFQFNTINTLPSLVSNSSYLIGYDFIASTGWAKYGYVPSGEAQGVSVNTRGNYVYYTGNYKSNYINLQSNSLVPYVAATPYQPKNHVYIACYTTNGSGVWTNATTDPGNNTAEHEAKSIVSDNSGNAYVVGRYLKTMNYLSTTGSPQLTSTGLGDNGFVLRANTATGSLFMPNNPNIDNKLDRYAQPKQSMTGNIVVPNPTNGTAKYMIKNYDHKMKYHISIYDAVGRIVYNEDVVSSEFYFDLSNQKSGVYFVHLSDGLISHYSKVIKLD